MAYPDTTYGLHASGGSTHLSKTDIEARPSSPCPTFADTTYRFPANGDSKDSLGACHALTQATSSPLVMTRRNDFPRTGG